MKRLATLALLFVFGSLTVNAAEDDPRPMLEQVANRMISEIEQKKTEFAENEDKARELVRRELLPVVHETALARRVLAKYWRRAKDEQKDIFTDKFTDLLIKTYAKGIALYDDQKFEFEETRYSTSGRTASVRSVMKRSDGPPVSIDYSLTKDNKGTWGIVDVSVEGISMVQSYRSQFAEHIQRNGLDETIKKLQEGKLQLKDAQKIEESVEEIEEEG